MKKLCLALILLVSAAWAPAAMNRQIDSTNFLLNDNCSATLIDSTGYFLTAAHCASDQFRVIERQRIGDDNVVTTEKVRVAVPATVSQLFYEGSDQVKKISYAVSVVLIDKDLDLALLKTSMKEGLWQGAPIACKDPIRGQHVYAVGNMYAVLYSSVTDGIISSVHRNYRMLGIDDQGDNGLVQSSASIVGGNSGGALYNDSGELIGVNVRGSQINETIALVVPLSDIKKFLMREGLDRLWSRCGSGK